LCGWFYFVKLFFLICLNSVGKKIINDFLEAFNKKSNVKFS